MPSRPLAIAPAGASLQWQCWDGDYIAYQPASTETHVFNESTALILQSLQAEGPLSVGDLVERIAQAFGGDAADLSISDLRFTLDRLETLGLIETVEAVPAP